MNGKRTNESDLERALRMAAEGVVMDEMPESSNTDRWFDPDTVAEHLFRSAEESTA